VAPFGSLEPGCETTGIAAIYLGVGSSDMKSQGSNRFGLAELLANAERLLEDAKVLRKSRKYASAVGLAVLSLEEAGKLVMRIGGLGPPGRPPIQGQARLHKLKQRMAASALIASMANGDVDNVLKELAYTRTWVKIDPNKANSDDEYMKTADIFAKITDDEYASKLQDLISEKHQARIIIQLSRGDFDELKQSALYVDIDDKNYTVSVPSIDRETTDRVLRIASRTITMLKRFVLTTPESRGLRA
jgi:AbiV family abortive infection protein